MKVIVAGGTGFVGSNVVKQCIAHPDITSVIVLSRREISVDLSESEKVRVLLHEDFGQWPASVLEELIGAEGCIWTIGGKATDFPTTNEAKRVSIGFTVAAAKSFATWLAPRLGGEKKFRFVYCSGWWAETNPKRTLFFMEETRKIKGTVESGLFEIAGNNAASFEVYALRPGRVLLESSHMGGKIKGVITPHVKVNLLALALIDISQKGSMLPVLENSAINRVGKQTLKSLTALGYPTKTVDL